jgi:hypothetical protein
MRFSTFGFFIKQSPIPLGPLFIGSRLFEFCFVFAKKFDFLVANSFREPP